MMRNEPRFEPPFKPVPPWGTKDFTLSKRNCAELGHKAWCLVMPGQVSI